MTLSRPLATLGLTVALGLAAVASAFAAPPAPRPLDEQQGDRVIIIGKLSVEHKGTLREVWRVDGYKMRGISRDKLLPLLHKRVRVDGEFRQLIGELILYVTEVTEASEDDPNR